jgi:hypothetical protein
MTQGFSRLQCLETIFVDQLGTNSYLEMKTRMFKYGWWPSSVTKLLRLSIVNKAGDEAKITRRLLNSFLNPSQYTISTHLRKVRDIVTNKLKCVR